MVKENDKKIKSDWHRADILAALKRRGTILARLSRESGLASTTLNNALARRWPKGERIIAQALGTTPEEIWPSRYISIANSDLSNGFKELKSEKGKKWGDKKETIKKYIQKSHLSTGGLTS